MRRFLSILTLVALLTACDDPLGVEGNDVPEKLVSNSLDLFSGDVVIKSSARIDDVEVWRIAIENSQGAITSFYWRKPFNTLFMIEGEKGPFNYELTPPLNVINLSTARFLAFRGSNKEFVSWKIFVLKSNDNRWAYRFTLPDGSFITIDAGSGDILR